MTTKKPAPKPKAPREETARPARGHVRSSSPHVIAPKPKAPTKKRMGRPLKDGDSARTAQMRLRITPSTKAAIESAAAAEGQTVTDFMIAAGLERAKRVSKTD